MTPFYTFELSDFWIAIGRLSASASHDEWLEEGSNSPPSEIGTAKTITLEDTAMSALEKYDLHTRWHIFNDFNTTVKLRLK